MKKALKITLIILVVVGVIIAIDTMQAIIFKNSPLISFRHKLEENSYIDKGILIDIYYCAEEKDAVNISWHFKTSKYACPINMVSNKVFLEVFDNGVTNNISISNEEADFILNLFNKYEYTQETCDGVAKLNLIVDNTTYGIEVYDKEIHITTVGKEMVLNKEDSIKFINIINKYVSKVN